MITAFSLSFAALLTLASCDQVRNDGSWAVEAGGIPVARFYASVDEYMKIRRLIVQTDDFTVTREYTHERQLEEMLDPLMHSIEFNFANPALVTGSDQIKLSGILSYYTTGQVNLHLVYQETKESHDATSRIRTSDLIQYSAAVIISRAVLDGCRVMGTEPMRIKRMNEIKHLHHNAPDGYWRRYLNVVPYPLGANP